MKAITTVWFKELSDTFRDTRTMLTSLLMGPLLGPLLTMGLMAMIVAQQAERAEKRLQLPIVGAEHAPNLVAWLAGRGVDVKPAPADPEAAVRNQDHDVILKISAAYADNWRASRPALVEIIHDSSRGQQTGVAVSRVRELLATYDRTVGALRLLARGVHPSVSSPLAVSERDIATPQAQIGMILSFLPYILILASFLGSAHLAIDSTAGERERQSLEPLLATPVAPSSIMSGKLAAASTFALLGLVLTLLAFKLSVPLMPTERIGFALDLSWLAVAKLFVVLFPLVLFGACLLTLLAAFAKSYKEAQSYMSLLILLPMLPPIILMVSPVKTNLWMLAVPFLGQNQLIMMIVRGEVISPAQWATAIGAGLVLATLTWVIAANLYRREQLAISA